MHHFIINASLQIIPIVQDKHPYEWVDEAISIIQQSTVKYEVGAFSTTLEGNYNEVMEVIHAVNEYLLQKGCAEWIANIQIQIRQSSDITGKEKTEKFSAL
ncbi:MAG: MTH1187 family thiamine-binding protein [Ferruginibacter sp.]